MILNFEFKFESSKRKTSINLFSYRVKYGKEVSNEPTIFRENVLVPYIILSIAYSIVSENCHHIILFIYDISDAAF